MKVAYTIFMICSGIIIVAGFIMIFTNERTAVNLQGEFRYKGSFSGAQVVVAGLIMALSGFWFKKEKKELDDKYEAGKKKEY